MLIIIKELLNPSIVLFIRLYSIILNLDLNLVNLIGLKTSRGAIVPLEAAINVFNRLYTDECMENHLIHLPSGKTIEAVGTMDI